MACREYTLPRDEDSSEPKGWIRGNTKIGPVLELTTCCLQGNYGVEIRIKSVNKDNSHSWVRIFSPRRHRAGNLRNAVRRICVQIECRWFCKPIKGQSKTTKTRFCQLIHKNYTYWEENLDWCWTRKIFALRLSSVEETDSSSSSWKSTSRQRRSDWILENKRISSDSYYVLSSLVWRKMEEQHGRRRRTKRKYFSIVLILQEQFCTSELSKVIQDAILLILHFRTMCLFRTTSSSTFITSDVQSIYIPSSIQDWYREDKFWATDWQCSFCLWIPWTKNKRILKDRLGSTASCTVHA